VVTHIAPFMGYFSESRSDVQPGRQLTFNCTLKST